MAYGQTNHRSSFLKSTPDSLLSKRVNTEVPQTEEVNSEYGYLPSKKFDGSNIGAHGVPADEELKEPDSETANINLASSKRVDGTR